MELEKKEYIAPKYTVVKFDSESILTQSGEQCMEIHSWQSGTDCHDQEMYLQQD